MRQYGSTERHPFVSLLLLMLLVVAGVILFSLLGAIIGAGIYGLPDLMQVLSGNFDANINLTKLLQVSQSVGMFIVPALLFAKLESRTIGGYLQLSNAVKPMLFLLAILIMISVRPVLEGSIELNNNMKLPAFLHELENWMRLKEDELAEVTKKLLAMKTPGDLLVTLLMIAILPAIGEELLFRGCLQHIFYRWTGNYHWGIWIAAIIFSAIHIQFYGFIPRMLLGALFGYLFVWGNNLWIPMLAHFLNNASAVIIAYVYQLKGISLDKLNQPEMVSGPLYLGSFIITSALLWYFYKKSYPITDNQKLEF